MLSVLFRLLLVHSKTYAPDNTNENHQELRVNKTDERNISIVYVLINFTLAFARVRFDFKLVVHLNTPNK